MTLLWELLSLDVFLWARKLIKKEGIVENYMTTFCNLNLGLLANIIILF